MPVSQDLCAESLFSAAKSYISAGFSVIPTYGMTNLARFKHPPIKWGRYQHSLATTEELQDWFCQQRFAGLALVTGRVSRLAVLDFDDPDLASEFRRHHPDLANTYTVLSGTRGLPHLYWRLPEGMLVQSRSVRGLDLRGEGGYVVAPPTSTGDGAWRVSHSVPMRSLTERDLRRVLAFMAAITPAWVENSSEPPSGAILGLSDSTLQASEFRRYESLTVDGLVDVYRRGCVRGRNNALFRAAMLARDCGWRESDVVVALVSVHVRQTSDVAVADESPESRYREALRTVASVFSRPRRQVCSENSVRAMLGSPVREELLRLELDVVARVFDGLLVAGLMPGALFTERTAVELLRPFGVGRRSVMAALTTRLPDELPVFARSADGVVPPCTPHSPANAALSSDLDQNSCEMSRGANRVKMPGRPARQFVLPDPAQLAVRLGVEHRPGDRLLPADLASPAAYRRAMHRELLKRRPGQYSRRWLTARLGVSEWTCRRYETALHVQVVPSYSYQPVSWSALDTLPGTVDELVPGVFLEDGNGRRYPALRPLAAKLLASGARLILKRQEANRYAVGIPTPRSVSANLELSTVVDRPDKLARQAQGIGNSHSHFTTSDPVPDVVSPTQAEDRYTGLSQSVIHSAARTDSPVSFWYCPDCLYNRLVISPPESCPRCNRVGEWQVLPDFIWQQPQALKAWWQSAWRERHPSNREKERTRRQASEFRRFPPLDSDAERMARRAHREAAGLSLRTARLLVERCGHRAVGQGLDCLKRRPGVSNPAGFLITYVRSNNKVCYNNITRVIKPDAAQWVRQMAESPYVSFLANAEDFAKSQSKCEDG